MDAKTQQFIAKLRDMRELIEWGSTQRANARDKRGEPLLSYDSRAVCWCLLGASKRVGLPPWRFTEGVSEFLAIGWNDHPARTQAQVLACIDNSIAALEGK